MKFPFGEQHPRKVEGLVPFQGGIYRQMTSRLGRHPPSRGCLRGASAHERTIAARKSCARTGNVTTGRSSMRHPHQRLHVAVGLAVALIGLGFLRADAFLLSATARGVGTRLAGARTTARSLGIDVGSFAGVSRRRACGMIMALDGGETESAKTLSIPAASQTTSETKEIKPPPDRDAALRMIKERTAKEREVGDLGPYAQADIPDLPKPPYDFQVPGEFGNDTLCTDPGWHRALLALKWLGMPFEVRHKEEEDAEEEGPILIMGDEVYDDSREVVSGLPERALLSDFVESLPYVTTAVEKLEPAWRALHYNNDPKKVDKLEKTLEDTLQKIENILARKTYSGEFFEGDELTVGDLTLGVTTFHMLAALGKQWKFPDKMVNLKAHMEVMHNMQIFRMVVPSAGVLTKKYAEPL